MFLIAFASLGWSQVKEFEVASVKASKSPDDGRIGIRISAGLWRAENLPLKELIRIAYDLKPGQLTGAPGWIESERFDIEAKLDSSLGERPKIAELRPYLQNLLETRFQLKLHREKKEMQVYVLGIAKSGTKFKESSAEGRTMMRMGMDQLSAQKANIHTLVGALADQLERPVLDETGLKGVYDFELKWAPDPQPGAPAAEGPSIFTAVQEQLGLKLDSRKAEVEVSVVDHVERPEAN